MLNYCQISNEADPWSRAHSVSPGQTFTNKYPRRVTLKMLQSSQIATSFPTHRLFNWYLCDRARICHKLSVWLLGYVEVGGRADGGWGHHYQDHCNHEHCDIRHHRAEQCHPAALARQMCAITQARLTSAPFIYLNKITIRFIASRGKTSQGWNWSPILLNVDLLSWRQWRTEDWGNRMSFINFFHISAFLHIYLSQVLRLAWECGCLAVLELATVSVDTGTFVGKSSSHF